MESNWEKIKNDSIMGSSFGKDADKHASSYEKSMEELVKASFRVRTKPSYLNIDEAISVSSSSQDQRTCPAPLQKYLRKRTGAQASYSFYHTIRYCFKNKYSLDAYLFIDLLDACFNSPIDLKWLSVVMSQQQQELIYLEPDWMALYHHNVHDSGFGYEADLLWRTYQRKLWPVLKAGNKEEGKSLLNAFYDVLGQLEEMPLRLEHIHSLWHQLLFEQAAIVKAFNQIIDKIIEQQAFSEMDIMLLESVPLQSLIDLISEKIILEFWDEQPIINALIANVSKNNDAEGALWILEQLMLKELFNTLSVDQLKRLIFPLPETVFEQFFITIMKDEYLLNSGRCLRVYLHSWQYLSYAVNNKILELYVRDCTWEEMERLLQRWVYAIKPEDLEKASVFFDSFIFRSPLRFADSSETSYLEERISFNKVAKRYGHII